MKAKLRGIFATISIAIGLAVIIVQIYFSRNVQNGRKARKNCRVFYTLNGFKIQNVGEFDPNAQLIIMNHQSLNDIMFLEGFHPSNICWVAKKQLGEIPFYGLALTLPQMIMLDREDKNGIVFLLREAKNRLEQGRPIVIFPEGTRGRGDENLLKFKPGAKILAQKLNLRIQPILLINTRKMYDSNPVQSLTNTARVVCLDTFTPDYNDEKWYEKLEKLMNDEYKKHYFEMNKGGNNV